MGRWDIGGRRGRGPPFVARLQLGFSAPMSRRVQVSRRSGAAANARLAHAPILKPDLRLTLGHAEDITDLLSSSSGRAPVGGEEALELGELGGSDARPFALFAGLWAATAR